MSLNFNIFEYMKSYNIFSYFTKIETKVYPCKDDQYPNYKYCIINKDKNKNKNNNWGYYITELLDDCDEVIIEIYDDILNIV